MTSLFLTLALSLVPSGLTTDDPPAPAGHWVGVLKVGPTELTLVFHVEPAGDEGGWVGTLDSPDQGSFDLEIERIVVDDRDVRFEMPRIQATFEGLLADEGEAIAGTFTQGGRPTPLTITRTAGDALPRPVDAPEALLGIWQGPIELPLGQKLRVALRVEPVDGEAEAEARRAYFDSIDQDVSGIPVTAISVEGGTVRFEVKTIGATFEGTLNGDRSRISGSWKQSILSMPLTLEKVESVGTLSRPQHPEPPFPYAEEDLTFTNPEAGIELAGTLTIPEGEGPFPAVVLVSGSGPQDRDETLLGHKPFLVIADHLTRAGIAVLRFDDRGVGRSGGDHAGATTEDFASDALAAVRSLQGRAEIDREAIGILGHSEGGVVGPMAAVEAPEEVAFLVLLAGTGVTGREILEVQSELIARASGLPDDLVEVQVQALRDLMERIAREDDRPIDAEEFEAIARKTLERLSPEQREALGETAASAALSADELQSPWFRFFLVYDPRPALRRVSCPVLALFGEKDLQVDPSQNAPEVEAALREGGNDRSEVVVLPGLNHLFQRSETGSPLEYGVIEETIAPEALEEISSWILSQTRAG